VALDRRLRRGLLLLLLRRLLLRLLRPLLRLLRCLLLLLLLLLLSSGLEMPRHSHGGFHRGVIRAQEHAPAHLSLEAWRPTYDRSFDHVEIARLTLRGQMQRQPLCLHDAATPQALLGPW